MGLGFPLRKASLSERTRGSGVPGTRSWLLVVSVNAHLRISHWWLEIHSEVSIDIIGIS